MLLKNVQNGDSDVEVSKAGETSFFSVVDGKIGRGAIAAKDIPPGTVVGSIINDTCVIIDHPTMHTIQLTGDAHVDFRNGLEFVNHSCDPNCYFRFVYRNKDKNEKEIPTQLDLIALRFIPKGHLLSFNYNISEWDMATPFNCSCGSKSCYKSIKGFKHLDHRERNAIEPFLSPYIEHLAQDQNA